MKKRLYVSIFLIATLLASTLFPLSAKALDFDKNKIIDDLIFDNYSSMSAGQIDAFLNNFASSCISPNSGFRAIDPIGYNPTTGFQYGGYVTAGQVISSAANAYGLNPQVLLVTLQKEQSLVSSSSAYCLNGTEHKYAAATGYGCPDNITSHNYTGLNLYQRNGVTRSDSGTTCVNSASKAGFSQQVIRAAWLLKFGQQRSKGNVGWAVIKGSWDNSDDPQSCYGGPMTQGTWQRCPSGAAASYDGMTTIDGTAVHIQSGATAALYWYTPHFHGNENFFDLFNSWFGSPYSGICESPLTVGKTDVLINNPGRRPAIPNFVIYSGASTNCVEFHAWNQSLNNWVAHASTNSASIDPANSQILFADFTGSGVKVPVLVGLRGTGSGKIEMHVWNNNLKTWKEHIETNSNTIDPLLSGVHFADINGDGRDEGILTGYGNGSTSTGKMEFHVWNPGFKTWNNHVVSNSSTMDASVSAIRYADLDGSGRDVPVLIGYGTGSTATGNIEFHVWNPGFTSWKSHVSSNSRTFNPALSKVEFADFNGDGRDEGALIGVHPHTGSGYIEFHIWNPSLDSWNRHVVTNQPAVP